MNVLEFHLWGSRIDDVEKPDRIVFDLDPDVGLTSRTCAAPPLTCATGLRAWPDDLSDALGRQGFSRRCAARAPGGVAAGEGLLQGIRGSARREAPDRYVSNMAKAKRKGRIFVDYLRNERGSTAIAPYSTPLARRRAGRYADHLG